MRLANDRDQEIIRSAISNSSISTTSFISSIGNGEAIAFGEAVAVPMRMRFARVEDARLPRAHGITDKVDDDAPPLADLRSIISRMRAVNGPDISSFQQSYLAAQTKQPPVHEENGLRGNPEIERFDRIRAQILSGDADRASDRSATAVKQQAGFGPPSSLREGSLRDSLLKRPLGSLIRK